MEAPAGVLVEGIARGYRRKGVYTVRSVLSRIGQTWRMYDGDIISMCSLRYQVFSRSLVCVSCGITGSYFAKEQSHHNNINPRSWHFNLYALRETNSPIGLLCSFYHSPNCVLSQVAEELSIYTISS